MQTHIAFLLLLLSVPAIFGAECTLPVLETSTANRVTSSHLSEVNYQSNFAVGVLAGDRHTALLQVGASVTFDEGNLTLVKRTASMTIAANANSLYSIAVRAVIAAKAPRLQLPGLVNATLLTNVLNATVDDNGDLVVELVNQEAQLISRTFNAAGLLEAESVLGDVQSMLTPVGSYLNMQNQSVALYLAPPLVSVTFGEEGTLSTALLY